MWSKGYLPMCVLFAVLYAETGQAMVLPKEVKRLMATVKNLESFMKAFNVGNITLGGAPSLGESVSSGLDIKHSFHGVVPDKKPSSTLFSPKRKRLNRVILGRSRVVSFSDTSRTPIILENAQCKPYPSVVAVPQPDHDKGFHYPFNVLLHRCAGSCHVRPKIQTCQPTETEEINLFSFVVAWSSSSDKRDDLHRSPRLIPMINHTKCGCKCIAKSSDCNPTTQRFSEDTCRCECKMKTQRCPTYQFWDPIECKCVCNPPQNVYCPRRFEWSPKKCSCVCKNTKCRANKIRNHRNCRCYCPKLPPCGKGLKRSRRDCKCKPYH